MGSTILQVRDVPEDVLARLRERAASRGISLSAYVRELLADEARQETMNEVIKRIATRAPAEVSDEEILAAIHEGRHRAADYPAFDASSPRSDHRITE
jgi:plasmid stability protein